MPKFNVTFERQVVERDQFTREIEADCIGEALQLAAEMACGANNDCPDDATSVGAANCNDWQVDDVKEIKA